jgi:Flp pilus assembly protein TadG
MEMAVVGPLVFIVLLGMLDLGVAVYSYSTLAEAVRAGTRYAAVRGSKSTSPVGPAANNASVEGTVRSYAPGVVAANLTVNSTWPDGNNSPGSRITVSATYNYRSAVAWIVGYPAIPLSANTTMVISH